MASSPRRFMMPDIDDPGWKNPGKQHTFEEFYIPAKDEDGNSHRVYCNIPGELYGWLSHVFASKQFPFQREGDMIRYAIYLLLCQLCNIDQSIPDMRELVRRSARVVWFNEAQDHVMSHLDYVGTVLKRMGEHQAWSQVLALLESEKQSAAEMNTLPGAEFWGRIWAEELAKRFGDLEFLAKSKLPPPPPTIDIRPSHAHHEEESDNANES